MKFLLHNLLLVLNLLVTNFTIKIRTNANAFKVISRELLLQRHPYHIVDPSPWPMVVGIGAFGTMFYAINIFHPQINLEFIHVSHDIWFCDWIANDTFFLYILFWRILKLWGFITLIGGVSCWFYDIIIEASYLKKHTNRVRTGLRMGMVLFIISEVFFFVSFFWAFFHSALSPSIMIGMRWPPLGIHVPNPWGLPLLNTVILLSSGVSITWAHRAILAADWENGMFALGYTIGLGLIFTMFQLLEYSSLPFSIIDGIYGSIFYVATGFHGLHVLIGTIFLIVCLGRQYLCHFTPKSHVGFECAAWYWHFVDVVWILLFISIYWWGS